MSLRFLTAGESHGNSLVVILEGLPAGLPIQANEINLELARRQRGYGSGARMKIEADKAEILSGVLEGTSSGAPIAIRIANLDHKKWQGKDIEAFTIPRPGHADLTGSLKFGYHDLRPALERASARETTARVAAGALCKFFLRQFGVRIGGYVTAIGEIEADLNHLSFSERLDQAESSEVRCPSTTDSEAMISRIRKVMDERDTLGGIVEVIALGVPAGLGSYIQWDKRLDGRLAQAITSIPGVKGVEIGSAFDNSRKTGSQAQDEIYLEGERLVRRSNRSGGIEGGITTGEAILVRAAMKPIATTLTPKRSVDLASGKEVDTQYERSDFCPVPRLVPIAEAMLAFVIADALIEKLGGDSLEEMKPRLEQLRQPRLADLKMDGKTHRLWPE